MFCNLCPCCTAGSNTNSPVMTIGIRCVMVNVQDVSSEWVLVSGPQARCKDIFNQPVLEMLWLFFFFLLYAWRKSGAMKKLWGNGKKHTCFGRCLLFSRGMWSGSPRVCKEVLMSSGNGARGVWAPSLQLCRAGRAHSCGAKSGNQGMYSNRPRAKGNRMLRGQIRLSVRSRLC